MSLRALPLMVIPFILYNIVAVFAGSGPATGPLSATIFTLPMLQRRDVDIHVGRLSSSRHADGAVRRAR